MENMNSASMDDYIEVRVEGDGIAQNAKCIGLVGAL